MKLYAPRYPDGAWMEMPVFNLGDRESTSRGERVVEARELEVERPGR